MYVLCQITKKMRVEEVDPLKSLWKNANTRIVELFVLIQTVRPQAHSYE